MKYRFGLIGRNISYSFSAEFFNKKFDKQNISDAVYEIFDLKEIEEVQKIFRDKSLKGINVTIPYKEKIKKYLDEISPEAAEIGAVNCISINQGIKKGYNTDVYGFEESLKPLLNKQHRAALILGSGGASKAVAYVLRKLEIDYKIVSRKGEFSYKNLNREIIENHQLIINCTPLGTFPEINSKPEIPYEFLNSEHFLYDLVYNPEQTLFLTLAKSRGAQIKNGLEMLKLQAEKSWEIWSHTL